MPILQANPFIQTVQADPIVGGIFNTANQSILNTIQAQASASNNRIATQLQQENAFLKEQRSAIARRDALDLEDRRRFERDRDFVKGLFDDGLSQFNNDRDFTEKTKQFGINNTHKTNEFNYRTGGLEKDGDFTFGSRPEQDAKAKADALLKSNASKKELATLAGLQQKVIDGQATPEEVAEYKRGMNAKGKSVAPKKEDKQSEGEIQRISTNTYAATVAEFGADSKEAIVARRQAAADGESSSTLDEIYRGAPKEKGGDTPNGIDSDIVLEIRELDSLISQMDANKPTDEDDLAKWQKTYQEKRARLDALKRTYGNNDPSTASRASVITGGANPFQSGGRGQTSGDPYSNYR